MSTFKALRVNLSGTIIPTVEQAPQLDLEDGDILISGEYSSINYKDALAITGASRIMKTYPCTAGIDVAGVVEQSNDARFKAGDKVLVTGYGMGERFDGGLAEKVKVKADYAVPMPASFDTRSAMILGTAGFTAGLSALRMLDNAQTPEQGPILVTGATGGVGSAAIHLLHKLGFEVHAVTRKYEQSADYLTALGADKVVDAHQVELGDKPLEKALYAGAIDSVGGDILSWITRVIRPEGNIASCGLAGGIHINTTVMPFILRGVNLLGVDSVNVSMPTRLRVWSLLSEHFSQDGLDLMLKEEITLDDIIGRVNEFMDGNIVGRYLVNLQK